MAAIKRTLNRLWQPIQVQDEVKQHDSPTLHSRSFYQERLEQILADEYPTLARTTYLDHAGTTPYAKSAIESWTQELTSNLFGNPHSASAASQLSTRRIEDIRHRVLKFFNADVEEFDLVFVANATAAIKLVAEAFRDADDGFRYLYHAESHTSLVGVRELAVKGSRRVRDSDQVEAWLAEATDGSEANLQLFGYPGQSNMTGLKLPLAWCAKARSVSQTTKKQLYTLLDVASLASTSPLDLTDDDGAPDFLALSFYKIFGFPDLGALIVRKQSAEILMRKKYFAGGTVDSVITSGELWHAKRSSIHAALEEGTLPFHNILALDHAMTIHRELFGSMKDVSRHTQALADEARIALRRLRHANGTSVCQLYMYSQPASYGPIIAFNLLDDFGTVISATEIEKLAIVKGIQLRTGGLCNPGGIAEHLNLSSEQIQRGYKMGYRCNGDSDVVDGKPMGVIRISFGAMSTQNDLDRLLDFVREYFVAQSVLQIPLHMADLRFQQPKFFVESLSVFPIKSCAAYSIPADRSWQVTSKGLAWDREWCIVHEGTNVALSQKKFPRMALLNPEIDLNTRTLRLTCSQMEGQIVEVDLDDISSTLMVKSDACPLDSARIGNVKVCGDTIAIHIYTNRNIRKFFSELLGTPCTLARYSITDTRRYTNFRSARSIVESNSNARTQIKLSNESPILVVNKASVEKLSMQIARFAELKGSHVPTVTTNIFRANIVVAPTDNQRLSDSSYIEDEWSSISIESAVSNGSQRASDKASDSTTSTSSSSNSDTKSTHSTNTSTRGASQSASSFPKANNQQTKMKLDILGPCRRCQMISISQTTGERQQEPFCTLAKTRRKPGGGGGVYFGVHAALAVVNHDEARGADDGEQERWIRVGDLVRPY